jgi:predicted MFS family arabinose efflux permease
MVALATGMGVGRFVYTPILPVMVDALGLSTSEAGLIASANFLGHLVGALLAALPLYRGSRYRYLLAALGINIAGLFAMAATDAFSAHLILRFLAGVAGAFVVIFSSALVLDRLANSGRSNLSSLHFAGIGVGVTVSAVVVAWLLAHGAGWRDLWIASGIICIGGFALSAWLIPAAEPAVVTPRAMPDGTSSVSLQAIIAAYGLFGFGYVITATFIVDMVRGASDIAHLEPYVWVLFGLSAVPSVALWTRLGRSWGALRTFAVASLVEAGGVAASALWLHTTSVIIAAVVVGGTFMGMTALGLIAARESNGGDPRSRIALVTVSFSAGQILGPAFAGYVYDSTGSLATPSLAASAALVGAAILSVVADAQRRGAARTANASLAARRPEP